MVVIAIIAILASMLLPALSKARSKARDIQCVNNLKNIMLGHIIYTMNNNDLMAVSAYRANESFNWCDAISMDGLGLFTSNQFWNDGVRWWDRKLFDCPKATGTLAVAIPYGQSPSISWNVATQTLITVIQRPSKILWICDNAQYSASEYRYTIGLNDATNIERYIGGPWKNYLYNYRHNSCVNVGFVDGHVAPEKFWLKDKRDLFRLYPGFCLIGQTTPL